MHTGIPSSHIAARLIGDAQTALVAGTSETIIKKHCKRPQRTQTPFSHSGVLIRMPPKRSSRFRPTEDRCLPAPKGLPRSRPCVLGNDCAAPVLSGGIVRKKRSPFEQVKKGKEGSRLRVGLSCFPEPKRFEKLSGCKSRVFPKEMRRNLAEASG